MFQLKNLGHLTCRVSPSLDFADCILLVKFNMFLCPLFSCTLAPASGGLVRLNFDPFDKTIGGGVSFIRKCLKSGCLSF